MSRYYSKRNKRLNWLKSRYSKPYKTRRALAIAQSASVTAVAKSQLSILATSPDSIGKAMAAAEVYIKTFEAQARIMNVEGRATR